jgi:hypothetical protein|tara:strand:+ start:150 stop:299 length:150 start_codon:yes stop_codon:yes gene_type:complete
MNFLIEIWQFLRSRKKLWLMPIILIMLLFGAIFIVSQGTAVAPFIYAIF